MDVKSIDKILKASSIFTLLDDISRKHLLSRFEKIELLKNEILFHQGDTSDSIYLLAEGKLATELLNKNGETKILGRILPGEIVGEMGALTNEPRSLTVKSLTNSILLKLPTSEFLEIVRHQPLVLSAIINPLISRTTGLIKIITMEKGDNNIVIVPSSRNTSLNKFSEDLGLVADKYPNTLIVSDYHPEFMDKHAPVDEIKNKIKLLMHKTKHIHTICYLLSSTETTLAKLAFKQNYVLYVVANANDEPQIDSQVLDRIEHGNRHSTIGSRLVLMHSPETTTPQNSIKWLNIVKFNLYHHVRLGRIKDYQKLLRFMRGKAVGIVLGGGGTRGWAHIGALKAIRELKIPIDIIGGTSVGAMVAGLYAMHGSYKKTYKSFRQIVIDSEHTFSWRSLTWPVLSLFNAKNVTNSQIYAFKNIKIEDLWTTYFCISSNLSANSEDIQQNGLLWEAVRASASVPALVPPMILNGELHVDGGLLNNLPVDVMRKFIGHRAKVIAIQLNNVKPDKTKYKFPPIFTLTDALLNRFGIRTMKYKFPPLLDTFLRALFLNSALKENVNALVSDVFVSFDLAEFKLLHSNQEEGERLVQIGYEETLKQIQRAKKRDLLPMSK